MNNSYTQQQANELMLHGNTIEKVSHGIEEQKQHGDVNVIIAKDNQSNWKVNPLNEFVILFVGNFQEIVKNYKLNNTDMLVLLEILKLMQMGNQVKITQQQIAKNTGKFKSQVSTCWKKFIETNIIIKTDDGSEFINPQLISKGSLKKQSEYQNYKKTSFNK